MLYAVACAASVSTMSMDAINGFLATRLDSDMAWTISIAFPTVGWGLLRTEHVQNKTQ